MPPVFVLETLDERGEWIDWARCPADAFMRTDDGAYLCTSGSSGLWLRCVRQDGAVLYCVDGGGSPFTYRLCPYPSARYSPR